MNDTQMDHTKYDYAEVMMPNIFIAYAKGEPRTEVKIEGNLLLLTEKLAVKYPQWSFVATNYWPASASFQPPSYQARGVNVHEGQEHLGDIHVDKYNPSGRLTYLTNNWRIQEARGVNVYEGQEHLGDIHVDRYNPSDTLTYLIDNWRIQEAAARGRPIKTKSMDTAVKTVAKMFKAKTLSERMSTAVDTTSTRLYHVHQSRGTAFRDAYTHVMHYLAPYIMENYSSIMDIAVKAGANKDTSERLETYYAEHKITEDMFLRWKNKSGAVVLLKGIEYALLSRDAKGKYEHIQTFSTETLPTHIKQAVGMLKLLDTQQFLKGVGVRVADDVFFITAEANNG